MKKQEIFSYLADQQDFLAGVSDSIWGTPETCFEESASAETLCKALEEAGFTVERGAAGISTAFTGTFGHGKPVIGFLGEFDALSGLSQEAGFIVTQFMSNMALYSALQPVVLLMCATYGWNPTGLYNMLWKATFTSYLTPLSTVAIPLCMSVGGYKQKDLIRMGLLPALVISVANILWVGFMFPPC